MKLVFSWFFAVFTLWVGVGWEPFRAALGSDSKQEPPAFRPDVDRHGILEFPANRAELKGQQLRLVPDPGYVGHWCDAKERIQWVFDLERSGRYIVVLEFAAPEGRGGSRFEVRIADQVRQGQVHATGSETRFLPQPLPTPVALKVGRNRLIVQALDAPNGFVMNLKRVRLIPAEE